MTFSSIPQILAHYAHFTPQAPAILAPGRDALTYLRLEQHANQIVDTFNHLGIGRGDVVAILLPNSPELALATISIACAAVSAPLNPAFQAGELIAYLDDIFARAVVTMPVEGAPIVQAAKALSITVIEFSPLLDQPAGLFNLCGEARLLGAKEGGIAQSDEVALLLPTSGATSRPKIVPLTHRQLCLGSQVIANSLQLTSADRSLNVMPLFHGHALIVSTLTSLIAGGSVVYPPGFSVESFYNCLAEFQPTWYSCVPTIHQAILARAKEYPQVVENSSLRLTRSAASAMPPKLQLELEATFRTPHLEVYGATEAGAQITCNPLPPGRRKLGSVGLPTGCQVKIIDPSGVQLPPGRTGEIVAHSERFFSGYHNNPVATRNAFIDGWFRAGDEGYMDEEGYLYFTGRIKEMINRGGEKIAPREVEEALLDHPAVAQAVAFAIPHPTLGEDVAAAVVLHPQATVAVDDIRKFLFGRLAPFKIPSRVLAVDEVPKNALGKPQRIGLARLIAEQLQPDYQAPRDEIEQALAAQWASLLHCDRVGVQDNFFFLGGDSILATQLVSRVRDLFQVELPLDAIFQEPDLASQAALIRNLILEEFDQFQEP